MRIIGVIPSRWGSTRFPGKSLALLAGKPLVQHVYEQAKKATKLDDVIVATDDPRIALAVDGFGGKHIMTRSDHPSGTDRVAEAALSTDADIIINIQGDEPLIEPALIDELAGAFYDHRYIWDMATAATAITSMEELKQSSTVKVVMDHTHKALYFSRSIIPCARDEYPADLSATYLRHIGIYAYTKEWLEHMVAAIPCDIEQLEKLEQLRALYLGCRMKVVVTETCSIGIDHPDDIPRAEALIKSMTSL